MPNQLQKAINLAKITGDRVIVVDSSGSEEAFAVMRLEEYEEFVLGQNEIRNLTEEELLNRINRDVAIWKSENDSNFEASVDMAREREEPKNPVIEDNLYYYQEPESIFFQSEEDEEGEGDDDKEEDNLPDEDDYKPKNHWKIPSSVKSSAEEVVGDAIF